MLAGHIDYQSTVFLCLSCGINDIAFNQIKTVTCVVTL